MTSTIRIKGALAEISGIDVEQVLQSCLRYDHPQKKFNLAFQRGDWDGKVELFKGSSFPCGLVSRVVERLTDLGRDVRIIEEDDTKPVSTDRLTPQYIVDPAKPGFALRAHQLDAIRAVLQNPRGVIKSPTGSGKSEVMIAAARYFWEELGYRTLIIEPKRGLALQTAERAELYYQGDVKVGLLADGIRRVGPVTVATAQTLLNFKPRIRKGNKRNPSRMVPADPILKEVVREYEILMFDECHRASSESWYEIAMASSATRRYGFSATPLVSDDFRDARLIGAAGPIILNVNTVDLIEQGYAAKPKIVMVMSENASGPLLSSPVRPVKDSITRQVVAHSNHIPYSEAYQRGIVENDAHNRAVVRAVAWLVERGRQTIVLSRRKAHFMRLAELMEDAGISFGSVWGATDSSDRDHVKRAFGERRIRVLLASTIFDEGEDLKSVEAIVLAEGVKVSTNSRQRVGRGMRPDSSDVWVVDFVPTCHPKLADHAYRRALAYEQEGYEVRVVEDWPSADDPDPGDSLLPFLDWEKESRTRA